MIITDSITNEIRRTSSGCALEQRADRRQIWYGRPRHDRDVNQGVPAMVNVFSLTFLLKLNMRLLF
jgi:hypothetical protein